MKTPCIEIDVQSVLLQLISFPLKNRPAEFIRHAPGFPGKSRCRNPDSALRRLIGKVDDNEVACVFMSPTPAHKVGVALVIGPSRPLAELPLPSHEIVAAKGSKKLCVKLLEVAVGRLLRTTSQEHGKSDAPPFELSVVEQHRALQGGHRDGRRPRL